jgi:hypothetical protein
LGSTTRFALSYPDLTDAPNGPVQLQDLAGDVEGWLCRAFRCTSSTRPTGVPNDFLIRESDTGSVMIWTGSAWALVSGAVTGGGGGGGTTPAVGTVSATFAATVAQPISTGTDVGVAFGVEQAADPAVTRSPRGAGHQFTLGQSRLWMVTATLRFAANGVGGRTFELRAGSGAVLAKESGPVDTNAPWTANLAFARKLPAGTVIYAVARHNAGTGIALEPDGGNFVHIDLAGV